jgi:hypothetical protein
MAETGKTGTKDNRARWWTIIVYPDSAPDNWQDIISEGMTQWACSPLHDADTDGTDESTKKPHWHIMIHYEGKKAFSTVKMLADAICAPVPRVINSPSAMARYLIHLDQPDKHQYAYADIQQFNGMDLSEYFRPTSAQRTKIIADMQHWVDTEGVTELHTLMRHARKEMPDWWDVLANTSTYIMEKYISSIRHHNSTATIEYLRGRINQLEDTTRAQRITIEDLKTDLKSKSIIDPD